MASEVQGLNIALLTLSDTRSLQEDRSGDYLANALQTAGHTLVDRQIRPDHKYAIRALISQWIADPRVQVILTTGGTGFSERDITPEAVRPLFDREIEGFGETFRQVSYAEIGSATIQSRCLAGIANATAIFCLPGSVGACQTGWNQILAEQLDHHHKPCNFASLLLQGQSGHTQ